MAFHTILILIMMIHENAFRHTLRATDLIKDLCIYKYLYLI